MGKPIGIDLGTTCSAIAGWKESALYVGPECYRFQLEEKNFIPSKIYIPDLNNREVNVRYDVVQYNMQQSNRKSFIRPSKEEWMIIRKFVVLLAI